VRRVIRFGRKWRPCLKCGRRQHTDAFNRICPVCTVENEKVSGREFRVGLAGTDGLVLVDGVGD